MSGEFEVMQQMQDSENAALRRKTEALEETVRHQSRVYLLGDRRIKLVMILLEEMLRFIELVALWAGTMLLCGISQAPLLWKIPFALGFVAMLWICVRLNEMADDIRDVRDVEDEDE